LDADIPGLTEHPMYDKFKSDSLRALAPKFGGAISDKDLAKVQADLAALSPRPRPASSGFRGEVRSRRQERRPLFVGQYLGGLPPATLGVGRA
jgi:hypothetical protein